MTTMYRVRVASSGWSGGPGLNTFYFQTSDAPTTTDSAGALACVTLVRAALQANRQIYPSLTTLVVSSTVDVLTASSGELQTSYAVAEPDPVAGNGAAAYGPTEAMVVLSFLTDDVVGGHRVRGRAFMGPLVAANDADGTPTSDLRGWIVLIGNALIGGTGGAPQLVVWHRPVSGAGGQALVSTGVSVADKWAVLRSRRD